jgi:hypothetical protein
MFRSTSFSTRTTSVACWRLPSEFWMPGLAAGPFSFTLSSRPFASAATHSVDLSSIDLTRVVISRLRPALPAAGTARASVIPFLSPDRMTRFSSTTVP